MDARLRMRDNQAVTQAYTHPTGYRFDDFYLDVENRELRREGKTLALNSKYFDVLLLLVSRAGRLVEKQRIFDEVWSGVFVTDAALTAKVKTAIASDVGVGTAANINVQTYNGEVQLSGFVSSPDEASRAVHAANSVNGVRVVRNDVRVK